MLADFPITRIQRSDLNLDKELWNVPHPPQELFIQGDPDAFKIFNQLPEYGLAVVGTRNPQARTCAFLERRIAQLASTPLIIISGMARGIDSVAHTAALKTGLPTVGILGTGLDLPYPKETLPLRSQILRQGGLLISEFPIGSPGFQSNFLYRNRLIAGWSKATWIVEASQRSGALNTARWAREQNRICFALPSFPDDPAFAGNQVLIDRDHAIPFWGVHSLGSAWLSLPLEPPRKQAHLHPSPITPQAASLLAEMQRLTHCQGGAPVSEMLDWALKIGWQPERFFALLDSELKKGRIQDFFGTLISTQ